MLKKNEDIKSIKNRIWITATTRVYAESRARYYDIVSHLALVSLSMMLISISIFRDHFLPHIPVDKYVLVFSTLTLAVSIVVWGFRFGEKATLHRLCYLQLSELQDSQLGKMKLLEAYHRILAAFPNHTDSDYEHFVLKRTLIHRRKIEGANGVMISWTWHMLVSWLYHRLKIAVLFLAIIGVFMLWSNGSVD
jgi:hypothetical protein